MLISIIIINEIFPKKKAMIRFFRNIRQKLAAENKVAAYLRYAIGEIVLVVVGILIALQINNWNEDRKSGIQETLYLNRLLEENKEDVANFNSYIKDLEKGIQAIELLSGALKSNDSSDSLLVYYAYEYFKYGSIFPIFTPSSSTFSELSSTGNLRVIRNTSLRDKLVKLYTKHKQVAERIRIDIDWVLPIDAPFYYQHNIMRYEPSSAFLFPSESLNKFANDLRTNRIFYINNSAAHFWINQDAIKYLKLLVEDTNAIVLLLNKELNNYD